MSFFKGALPDGFGYAVDVGAAEPFSLPDQKLQCLRGNGDLHFFEGIFHNGLACLGVGQSHIDAFVKTSCA